MWQSTQDLKPSTDLIRSPKQGNQLSYKKTCVLQKILKSKKVLLHWTQEAYRLPRSKCSLCWWWWWWWLGGGTPSSHGGGGYPIHSCGGGGYPIQSWWGDGVPPPSRPGKRYPPPTIHTWDGVPPPPPPMVNRQTFPSINITFPRTTYAGGNKKNNCMWNEGKRLSLVVCFAQEKINLPILDLPKWQTFRIDNKPHFLSLVQNWWNPKVSFGEGGGGQLLLYIFRGWEGSLFQVLSNDLRPLVKSLITTVAGVETTRRFRGYVTDRRLLHFVENVAVLPFFFGEIVACLC